jgi:hypothetical protein
MSDEFEKYDAFAKRMEERFPQMFAEPYGGFCVGEGWWPILEALCGHIQHHINWKNKNSEVVPQVTVAQIKERFPTVTRFVTLSPKTEMARRFHHKNGATTLRENSESVNYEYPTNK